MSGVAASSVEAPMSIRKSLFWSGLGQGGFFVLQFGSSVILARLLSPREMGVFAIAAATTGLISVVQALGLNNYVVRAEKLDRPILATIFTVNLILSVALSAAIVVLGLLTSRWFNDPMVNRVMLWLAVTPLVGALGIMPTSLLQREGNFRALSLLRIMATLGGTGLTIGTAWLGYSSMSLAWGWVLTCTVNALGACALAPRHLHVRLGLSEWRHVTGFGMTMIVINGLTQVQRQVLSIAMGRIQGLAPLGLFTRGGSLFNILSENIQTAAVRVFLVDFAQAARRGDPLGERYCRVIDFMTALLWPLFAGLAVLAGPCVRILYGGKWDGVAVPLALLCLSGMLWVAVAMAWELFVIADQTRKQAKLEVIRTVFGSALFLGGCYISLNAAVATRIVESLFAVLLYGPSIRQITGVTWREIVPIYGRSAILAVTAVIPATMLMMAWHWSPAAPILLVFASVAAGVGLFILVAFLMKHPIIAEARRLVVKRRGGQAPA
jgi:O-antigen/teichoic acid export membrane protein